MAMRTPPARRAPRSAPRSAPRWTSALLSFAVMGCASSTEPDATVTLLVVNATCDPGPCATLGVRGFPQDQPHTPGGLWSLDLGTVTTASACLTLPPSAHFDVSDASGHTTTHRWTPEDALSIGVVADGQSTLMAAPSTAEFVPAREPAWTVTLPGGTTVTPDVGCNLPID